MKRLFALIAASRILYLYDETSTPDVAMRQELEGWLYSLHREHHHTTRWARLSTDAWARS